jgi:hypothetical protein
MDTHKHTCTHVYAYTHACMDTPSHARMHIYAYRHACRHALTHARTHPRTHTHTHAACIHTHAHTHAHTCTHSHTCMNTSCLLSQPNSVFKWLYIRSVMLLAQCEYHATSEYYIWEFSVAWFLWIFVNGRAFTKALLACELLMILRRHTRTYVCGPKWRKLLLIWQSWHSRSFLHSGTHHSYLVWLCETTSNQDPEDNSIGLNSICDQWHHMYIPYTLCIYNTCIQEVKWPPQLQKAKVQYVHMYIHYYLATGSQWFHS